MLPEADLSFMRRAITTAAAANFSLPSAAAGYTLLAPVDAAFSGIQGPCCLC